MASGKLQRSSRGVCTCAHSLAADKSKAVAFYKSIKNKVLNNIAGGGGVIDLIMGDTNQPHAFFSPENISAGMDGQFRDAHSANAPIIPADTYAVSFKGTNSVDNKKFNVAIYNTATVKKWTFVTSRNFPPWVAWRRPIRTIWE